MDRKEEQLISLLKKHKGIIYKVAYSYCKEEVDREDLIQDIVIQIWLSLDRFNPKYQWTTWIYRIALNTAISQFRKQGKRKRLTQRLSPLVEIPQAEDASAYKEDIADLHRCIRSLREIDRALILLYLDGLSTTDMAEVLNTSQTNITTRLSRIRTKLKDQFKKIKQNRYGKH